MGKRSGSSKAPTPTAAPAPTAVIQDTQGSGVAPPKMLGGPTIDEMVAAARAVDAVPEGAEDDPWYMDEEQAVEHHRQTMRRKADAENLGEAIGLDDYDMNELFGPAREPKAEVINESLEAEVKVTSEGEQPLTPITANSPKTAPAPSQTPDWMPAMQSFMQAQQAHQQQFFEKVVESLRPPEKPAARDDSPAGFLRELINQGDGDHGDGFVDSFLDALVADRFRDHPSWKDSESAQRYTDQARDRFARHRAQRGRESELAKQVRELQETVRELKEQPVRARNRQSAQSLVAAALGEPQPDHNGVTADDVVQRRFPAVARITRAMQLGPDLANYALDKFEAGVGQPYDGNDPGHHQCIWQEIHGLNGRLAPIVELLQATDVDKRPALVRAMKASATGDAPFASLIDRVAQGVTTLGAPPATETQAAQPVPSEVARAIKAPSAPTTPPTMEHKGRDVPSPDMGDSWDDDEFQTAARFEAYKRRKLRELNQAN